MTEVVTYISPFKELLNAKTAIVVRCVFDKTNPDIARILATRYLNAELAAYKKTWGEDGYQARLRMELIEQITTGENLLPAAQFFKTVSSDTLSKNRDNHEIPVKRGIAISFNNLADSLT